MTPPIAQPDALVFTHEAMNTTFCLRLIENRHEYAMGVARECFDLLDETERKLSRFIDGSDVFRINRMQAGETLYLSETCHQCLLLSMQANAATGGLFDVTLGTRIQHRKSGAAGTPPPLLGKLIVHPEQAAITCEIPGREIDLGGIGKGFVLDLMKDLLLDWEVNGGLLAAGASTLLAFGPQAWPVELSGDLETRTISLTNQVLSASGTDVQGNHIVHPAGDDAVAGYLSQRVWAVSRTGTMAEAWSTALMLMRDGDVGQALAREDSVQAAYAEIDGRIVALK